MSKLLFGLFCLTALSIGCSSMPAESELTPVSEQEFSNLMNNDNAKITNLYNKMATNQTSACMQDKSEFGLTEICKSFEHNLIFIKRNNQVIFQSPIFVQEEKIQNNPVVDLSI